MLATLLTVGLPALLNIVKDALSSSSDENIKTVVKSLDSVKEIPKDVSLDKAIEKNLSEEIINQRKTLEAVNKTIITEVSSSDKFVSRMRPTFGYIMAITWFFQMLSISYIIVFDSKSAGVIISAFSELSLMWSVGLSVLGVYVYARSNEKKTNNIIKNTKN